MQWKGRRQSGNIEDRRGLGGGMRMPGLGGGGGFGGRGLGLGGIVVLVIVAWIFGINPLTLLSGGFDSGGYSDQQSSSFGDGGNGAVSDPSSEETKQFVAVVLANTEDTWHALLPRLGAEYREPRLVLFSGGVQSACGFAQSAVGPFYCPTDEKVYLDLDFFDELTRRLGAPGDFAEAYVVAHEIGHHVQKILGIEEQTAAARGNMSEAEANALSVRVELQADCFAGIWANHAQAEAGLLEPGDIEEALGAASAVGDDTLQKQATGRVMPDSFTHGSAAQRTRWFEAGYRSGDTKACDTFGAKNL